MKNLILASAGFTLALTACGGDPAEPDTAETQAAPSETGSAAVGDNDTAQDFDTLKLGAKIVGPVGPEVEASFNTDLGSIGDIEGYVACTDGTATCDPKAAAADMIYTYVYQVTPGVDAPNDAKFPQSEAVSPVSKATAFKMVLPAVGFTGDAGYSFANARKALGNDGAFTVTCSDQGLAFEIARGTEWSTGEPITFFWRSTVPPKGPMDAFLLEADGKTGIGAGPSPTTRGDGGNNEKAVCP